MGMRFSYSSVLAVSVEQQALLLEELKIHSYPGEFVSYDYDDNIEFPEALDDFGTRELSERYGEAIYILYYDGGAAELCGTILYEHSRNGEILRALAYSPNLWTNTTPYDDQELRWRRIEGQVEAWEAAAFNLPSKDLDVELQKWINYGYEGDVLARYKQNIHDVLRCQCLQPDSLFPTHVQDSILHAVESYFNLKRMSPFTFPKT